jgi:hypothetical protein
MMAAMAYVDLSMRFAGLSLVLALSACKSSAPPKQTTTTPPASASFDGLFRADASWRFTVNSESSMWDDSDPAADANGNVVTKSTGTATCKVIATRSFPGGRASQIECDDAASDRVSDTIGGVWIQNADGLWRTTALPDEGQAPTLEPYELFLAANPKPGRVENKEPEGPDGPAGGSGEIHEIEVSGDGWCVTHSSWGGDESWRQLCIDSKGPAGGNAGWAGGSTQESTFQRIE